MSKLILSAAYASRELNRFATEKMRRKDCNELDLRVDFRSS
jgi:hypothetical protein